MSYEEGAIVHPNSIDKTRTSAPKVHIPDHGAILVFVLILVHILSIVYPTTSELSGLRRSESAQSKDPMEPVQS